MLKSLFFTLPWVILYIVFIRNKYAIGAAFLGFPLFLPNIFLLPGLINAVADYFYLLVYIKNKRNKSSLSSGGYKHAIFRRSLMSGVVWAFCIFIILGVFSMYLQEKNKLPMALAPEYVLTLAEVYDDNLTIQAGEFSTTRSYRFAAWTKYNQDATDKRTGALIILRGDVFIAENLSYAHQMIKALTHHWGNVFGPFLAFTNQTENPGFDELYMNEDYQDHGQIIARKGNYVYHIIYIQDGEKILYALYKQASNIK